MKSFEHSSYVGDFFAVLAARETMPMPPDGSCQYVTGRTRKQEAVLILCRGDFGILQTPSLAASLDALLTGNVRFIVLDLSDACTFSANAAAVLVNFIAGVRGRHKECVILCPSQPVRTILNVLDLGHLFTIRESEEELLLDLPDQPLS